jgi:DUF971 family protein
MGAPFESSLRIGRFPLLRRIDPQPGTLQSGCAGIAHATIPIAGACSYNLAVNHPSSVSSTSPTQPQSIHADRGAGTFEIEWRDGHRTRYDTTTLRWLCPCAYCRGEAGMPGYLDSAPQLSVEQTRLVDVHLVGQYALAPTWGDGHHTGYYTFGLLRERCPCAACGERRTRGDHAHSGA